MGFRIQLRWDGSALGDPMDPMQNDPTDRSQRGRCWFSIVHSRSGSEREDSASEPPERPEFLSPGATDATSRIRCDGACGAGVRGAQVGGAQ